MYTSAKPNPIPYKMKDNRRYPRKNRNNRLIIYDRLVAIQIHKNFVEDGRITETIKIDISCHIVYP